MHVFCEGFIGLSFVEIRLELLERKARNEKPERQQQQNTQKYLPSDRCEEFAYRFN